MNVVMQDAKNFIEVQGTGEHASFDRNMLNTLLDLGENACKDIYKKQMELIGGELP
jgi:ribonuclease PH